MALDQDLRDALDDAIATHNVDRILELLEFEGDIGLRAEALFELEDEAFATLFNTLNTEQIVEMLEDLDASTTAELLGRLDLSQAASILDEMDPDDATDVIERMEAYQASDILVAMGPVEAAAVRDLLVYPADTAGGRMTPQFVSISPDLRADEAVALLRRVAQEAETLNYVYVTDAQDRLLGVVSMRNLVLSRPDVPLSDLMVADVISIEAEADQEEAARLLNRYNLFALPVVDADNHLLGIITADDIAQVVQEEATEDFHRVAAVRPLEMGYRQTPIRALYRKRIGWLLVLVIVGISSASVLHAFEAQLADTVALAFFIPLLLGSGGNTGSQSATLVVRALATGDLRLNEGVRAIWKEIRVGLSLGVTMALATAVLGLILGGADIAVVVALTMLCIVLTANLIGALLPLLLTRLGLDPATASSPLIASVMDTLGLLIYFTIAAIVLGAVL
jgi:magnesium transporter